MSRLRTTAPAERALASTRRAAQRTHFHRDARDARGAPMGVAMPVPRARPTRPLSQVTKERPLISVVDDDPYVRKAFGRLIRSAGFAVETFPAGAEFLKSLTDHQPDCVLLDLHMPIQDGLEVHAQLTREHFAIPVVVIDRKSVV